MAFCWHRWIGLDGEAFEWRVVRRVPGYRVERQYRGEACAKCGAHRWKPWIGWIRMVPDQGVQP